MNSFEWAFGIDLSLTGTGLALVQGAEVSTRLVTSKGSKSASLDERNTRLMRLSESITWCELLPTDTLGIVVIEQPSYGSVNGSHHDRSGLWWLVVSELLANEYKVAEVPPTTLKKYVSGKGNAGKDEMVATAVKRYPDADIRNNNVADAVGLAAMGARHIGLAIDDLPARNLESMGKVRWPR